MSDDTEVTPEPTDNVGEVTEDDDESAQAGVGAETTDYVDEMPGADADDGAEGYLQALAMYFRDELLMGDASEALAKEAIRDAGVWSEIGSDKTEARVESKHLAELATIATKNAIMKVRFDTLQAMEMRALPVLRGHLWKTWSEWYVHQGK